MRCSADSATIDVTVCRLARVPVAPWRTVLALSVVRVGNRCARRRCVRFGLSGLAAAGSWVDESRQPALATGGVPLSDAGRHGGPPRSRTRPRNLRGRPRMSPAASRPSPGSNQRQRGDWGERERSTASALVRVHARHPGANTSSPRTATHIRRGLAAIPLSCARGTRAPRGPCGACRRSRRCAASGRCCAYGSRWCARPA